MRAALLPVLLLLSGCNPGYYWHLTEGHLSLMSERRPLEEVLADPELEPVHRQQLEYARQVLDWAGREAGLSTQGSYHSYVGLERHWVVWNLFAAPELSLQPHQWCYPVAGCVSYRGYFDRARAGRTAERLRAEGLEVYGAGAIAYSTLGWFDDPLTTPMLRLSRPALAELLLHELVHQRLYVSGDTRFNESLATAVAEEATRRWLAAQGGEEEARLWRRANQARARVLAWVEETRAQLHRVYDGALPEADKRAARDRIRQALRQRFHEEASDSPALQAWTEWFRGPLNNAQLNTLTEYNGFAPAFNRLLLRCGGHWDCFWHEAEALAALGPEERHRRLRGLTEDGAAND